VCCAVVLSVSLASACGTSTSTSDPSTQAGGSNCRQVNAALSDGPDPQADPVGYALAQVAPLRRLAPTTSDPTLRQAMDRLVTDFEAQYRDNGTETGVNKAVNRALAQVQSLCPAVPS
jgi:hypothetical protein